MRSPSALRGTLVGAILAAAVLSAPAFSQPTCESSCSGLQARCTTSQQCCPGTSCTPLNQGTGHSVCLSAFSPFSISPNLGTVSYQTDPSVAPTAAVVFLHGLAMDKEIMRDYFFALVDEVKGREGFKNGDHVRFVFADAPVLTGTTVQRVVNVTGPVRGWWDGLQGDNAEEMFGLFFQPNPKHVEASALHVQSITTDLVKSGIPACRIFVAGYSQGSTIALQTALTYGSQLAGAAGMACYFVPPPQRPVFDDVPVFIGHGLFDTLLPFYTAQLTARALNAATPGSSPYAAPIPAFLDLAMTHVTFKGYPIVAGARGSDPGNILARLSPFIAQRNHTLGADEVFDAWNFMLEQLPA